MFLKIKERVICIGFKLAQDEEEWKAVANTAADLGITGLLGFECCKSSSDPFRIRIKPFFWGEGGNITL
jgi:hypothetical protein